MAKQKQRYYVVWAGREQGIYTDWETCKAQIEGFKGAQYKSFSTMIEAEQAFINGPTKATKTSQTVQPTTKNFKYPSLSVDAACSGNPGIMEYQGVDTKTGQKIFHQGPFQCATNNIGEFLAIVHGLAYMHKYGFNYPIYSDSKTAQSWIRQKQCKTKLTENNLNHEVFELIKRAEKWLQTHTYQNEIIKWDTKSLGEIPADFGRK